MSDIKKKLEMSFISFTTASKLYENVIENNKNSQAPNSPYMQDLLNHHKMLISSATHSKNKSRSKGCLLCEKVLDCQVACVDFKTDSSDSK